MPGRQVIHLNQYGRNGDLLSSWHNPHGFCPVGKLENCPLTRWSAWSSGWGARRGEERARSWQAWLGPTGHEILGVWEHPAPQRWPLRAQEKYFRFKTCLAMAAKQGSAATNAAGTRQTSRSGGSGGGRTSGSGEPGGSAPVNVFQDHERAAGLSSTKAELFKKLDALVYPGRPAKEKTDNMPASERFAMCAAGMHGGASGFKRMSTLRTKTGVKREYDTLLSYQCATCSKNRACNLALRPPVDHMRLFVPGKERVARGEGITYHMVFKEDHALQLERAGFTQVQVEFHAPDLELNGFDALPEQGGASSSKRRRTSGPRVADSGGASGGQPRARSPDAAAQARERALQTLQMPVDVPTWTSCKQLAAMMEEPFETHDDVLIGGDLEGNDRPSIGSFFEKNEDSEDSEASEALDDSLDEDGEEGVLRTSPHDRVGDVNADP